MRKITLAVALLFVSASCWAEDEITAARVNTAKRAGWFVAGYLSGFGSHELHHAVIAKTEGVGMEWSGGVQFPGRWTAHSDDKEKIRRVAIAGFVGQVLSTEVILGIDAIPKNNAFILGWLAYNISNAVYYTAVDNLRGGYGDFESLRNNGMNTDLVKVGLLAEAAISAYRIYRNPKFIPYVQAAMDELVVGLSWRW